MHLIDLTHFCLVSFTFCHIIATVLGLPAIENKDYNYSDDQGDYNYNYDESDIDDIEKESEEVHYPVILTKPKKIVSEEGTTINLPCHVDKLAGNIALWYKDDFKNTIAIDKAIVNGDSRATVKVVDEGKDSGSFLIIRLSKPEDDGVYVCQIQNNKKPEVMHNVTVVNQSLVVPSSVEPHMPSGPSVEISSPGDGDVISSISQTTLNAKKGDDVTLTCKGEGSPSPTVTWTRLGKKMPDGSASKSKEVITYTEVNRHHEGTYKCTASNGSGNDASKTIKVVVEYAPEIEVEQVFIHSQTGDSVELVCNVHAEPRPKVVWSKDGEPIKEEDHANIEVKNMGHKHTLNIENLTKDDYGIYHCEAKNTLGEAKQKLEISGNAQAAKFSSTPTGQEDTTFNLEWSSRSYSPITAFVLDYKAAGRGSWTSIDITPDPKQYPLHYSGKHYFKDLWAETNYQARVKSKNNEGWSEYSKVFDFATKGAAPRSDNLTSDNAGDSGCSLQSSLFTIILALTIFLSLRQN